MNPHWSPHGTEIFYIRRGDRAIMAVPVSTSSAFASAAPQLLFEGAAYIIEGGAWNVDENGRFLMAKADTPPPSGRDLVLVQDWIDGLARLVPVTSRLSEGSHNR